MYRIGSKGAIPEQIPVNFIILLAMFAVGAAVLLLMIGRWLDMEGIKYKMETQRNAMNIMQILVSNSPVVKRDSSNVPMKLTLDGEELDRYQINAGIGTEVVTPDSERDIWEKCCDFLDFDYSFTVRDLETDEEWTISNLIFKQDSVCYPQRVRGFVDLPVVIYKDGRRDPGVAVVEMIRTPLSELSFRLSQAFLRASWDKYWEVYSDQPYYVKIPLDPEIDCVRLVETDCSDNYGRVCVRLTDGREACKMFVCENGVNGVTFDQNSNYDFTGSCFDVSITVRRGEVSIIYPGVCS